MAIELPETGYLRLRQIVRTPATKTKPGTVGVFPVSRSTWYAGIRSGVYPAPIKLSPRCSAWPVEAIRTLIETTAAGGMGAA